MKPIYIIVALIFIVITGVFLITGDFFQAPQQICYLSPLEKTSIDIYNQMATVADAAGFILADLKLEFGLLDGEIILGDSIGPDEYRLWPKESYAIGKIQESYDKQILRDWLTANGLSLIHI